MASYIAAVLGIIATALINSRAGRRDGWGNRLACSPYWLSSRVVVSGHLTLQTMQVPYCNWNVDSVVQEIKVPIEMLKFARRVEGDYPLPGINQIEIVSGHARNVPIEFGDHDFVSFGIESARFEATAPVVFVHGMDSDDGWFRKYGFDQEFRKKRIGYAFAGGTSVQFGPAESLGNGPARVIGLVTLLPRLQSLSREFGVPYFHLVAHSKGGLYARGLLELGAARTRVGVYSLTTLATLHRGAVLADLMIAANCPGVDHGNVDWWDWQKAKSATFFKNSAGYGDLTTEILALWDQRSRFPFTQAVGRWPHLVQYRAQVADETLRGPDGRVVARDCEGYGLLCSVLQGIMGRYSRITLLDTSGRLTAQAVGPGGPHDLAVSVASASGPGRESRFVLTPRNTPWPNNHTTIGKDYVGSALSATYTLMWEQCSKGL